MDSISYYLNLAIHQWPYALLLVAAFIILGSVFFKRGQLINKINFFTGNVSEKKEYAQLKKYAESGDVEAQITLGDAYYKGIGVEKDLRKAIDYYLRAAKQDNVKAQLKLGDAYYPGTFQFEGSDAAGNNRRQSGRWSLGDEASQAGGAVGSTMDDRAFQSEAEARKWYLKAAKLGSVEAQSKLLDIERIQQRRFRSKDHQHSKKAEIAYEEEFSNYYAILTAENIKVFEDAGRNPSIVGKKGEDFIKAIAAAGGILSVERYKDKVLNDGPSGEPAFQAFSDNGAVTSFMRHKDGKPHDGPNGEAAFQSFSASGRVHRITHYKNGMRHDGDNGEAAFLLFGEDGNLVWVVRYKEDKLVKALNDKEVAAYLELSKVSRNIEAAIPGLKIH